MKLYELVTAAAVLAACSGGTPHTRAHSQEAGGSSGADATPESAAGAEEDVGASGAPTQAQAGAGGEAGNQQSDGGSAGDAQPNADNAGAGGDAGSPSAGPAPGSLWGYCNVDPQSPDPRVLCANPAHSCWPWLDPADLVVKHLCAPGCDSVQFRPGSNPPKSFFGLDPALKAECEARGGECGRLGPDWQNACYPRAAE